MTQLSSTARFNPSDSPISRLRQGLQGDFINTVNACKPATTGGFTEERIAQEIIQFVRRWFQEQIAAGHLCNISLPDPEQCLAIGTGRRDTLVLARAGSGKTATIVNRAVFLNRHCRVPSLKMLILAFNRAAADEVRQRLEQLTGDEWPQVMTFHALAYGIAKPSGTVVGNELGTEQGEYSMASIIQRITNQRIQSAEHRGELRDLMLTRWRKDWESLEQGGSDMTRDAFLAHRRADHLPRVTLKGDRVKSWGEKLVANFLFEHNVTYHYESAHLWNERSYRPDFTLPRSTKIKSGVIIEYFGMQGDPSYDEQTKKKCAYWSNRPQFDLIEVYPRDLKRRDFADWLQSQLNEFGIQTHRLNEDEIWEKAEDRSIREFTRTITNFISRARQRNYSSHALQNLIAAHSAEGMVERPFLALAASLHGEYLDLLQEEDLHDHPRILADATREIDSGATTLERLQHTTDITDVEFLFMDEYQDFNLLFSNLVASIRAQNSKLSVFAVGDDWQAINGFAGSDLRYFHEFEEQFENPRTLFLGTNYRSCKKIVEASNNLMRKTQGLPGEAATSAGGQIFQANLPEFARTPHEEQIFSSPVGAALSRMITAAFAKGSPFFQSIKGVDTAEEVVLLSRTNEPYEFAQMIGGKRQSTLDALKQCLVAQLTDPGLSNRIRVSTVHGFKGKQGSLVILVDAINNRYPLVHPDSLFNSVLGDTPESTIEEERRLFYVALTRAEHSLIVLTDKNMPSPFIDDIQGTTSLDWSTLSAPHYEGPERWIFIENDNTAFSYSPTASIARELRENGFKYRRSPNHSWAKPAPASGFDPQRYFNSTHWPDLPLGLRVELRHGDLRLDRAWSLTPNGWGAKDAPAKRLFHDDEMDIPF